jgi:hypothetical protein
MTAEVRPDGQTSAFQRLQRLGAVNWLVRLPAAHAVRDIPLSKTPEGAIMAHN